MIYEKWFVLGLYILPGTIRGKIKEEINGIYSNGQENKQLAEILPDFALLSFLSIELSRSLRVTNSVVRGRAEAQFSLDLSLPVNYYCCIGFTVTSPEINV